MAEDNIQEQPTEEPQGETEQATDWKAEARKWEARAKKSAQAEAELEALKQAQMTEQEKANARADAAEKELASLKAEAQRMADAREVSQAQGIPLNLLEFCADKEAMEAFAAAYKALQTPSEPVHSASSTGGSRVVKSGEKKPETRDQFAEFLSKQLR